MYNAYLACTNKQCATIENYRPKANTLAYCLYRFSLIIIRIVISGSHRVRDTFAGSHMCGICVVRIDCINQDHCHSSLSGHFFLLFLLARSRAHKINRLMRENSRVLWISYTGNGHIRCARERDNIASKPLIIVCESMRSLGVSFMLHSVVCQRLMCTIVPLPPSLTLSMQTLTVTQAAQS